jgi:hypothetical protein
MDDERDVDRMELDGEEDEFVTEVRWLSAFHVT